MLKRNLIASAVLIALASSVSLAGGGQWLHIRVEDGGPGGERVNVNVPLSLIEAILPTIQADGFRGGGIEWHDDDLDGIDLRAIIAALRDAPDADYITVQGDDEEVRVSKKGDMLLIRVEENNGDRVRVRVPLQVIDAMFNEDTDEIDLVGALRALGDFGEGDLVTVESDDESVRIWVDYSQSGD